MLRWSKDSKEFVESVIDNKASHVIFSNTAKPIGGQLGNLNSLKFLITRDKIVVKSGDD